MNLFSLLVATLPALVIAGFIYWQDKHEKEQPIPLLLCFLLGMVITFPARWLEIKAYHIGWHESENFPMTIFVAFTVVAFNEELFKFIALVAYPFKKSFFNEPFDGIVYATMIGMGFAALENMLYVNQYSLSETWGRAFTAVPSHGVYAIMMGYFAGLAKFNPQKKWKLLGLGLLSATLMHGIYDLFLIQQIAEWLMLLSVILLYGSMYFAWSMLKAHQMNSPYKNEKP